MITSPYPHPPITPPDEHPRVMLRAADLPRLRRNIKSNPTVTAMWRELCETPLVRIGAMPEYGTYHLRDYLILEARALSCLLNPDAAQSRALQAVEPFRFGGTASKIRFQHSLKYPNS